MDESLFEFDVFLSHHEKDKQRVRQIAEDLAIAGLKVFFDENSIHIGTDIYLAVEQGLAKAKTFILCMSSSAFESDWVTMEYSTVLFRDPTNTEGRFGTILLEDCSIPPALGRFKYVDCRHHSESSIRAIVDFVRRRPIESSPAPAARHRVTVPGLNPKAINEVKRSLVQWTLKGETEIHLASGLLLRPGSANFKKPSAPPSLVTVFLELTSLGTEIPIEVDCSQEAGWVLDEILGEFQLSHAGMADYFLMHEDMPLELEQTLHEQGVLAGARLAIGVATFKKE